MKTITKIKNSRVFHKIEYEIDLSDIENITSYMIENESCITFNNGKNDEYYNNLLDKTGNFKFTDCDILFNLSILDSTSIDELIEFHFSEGYEERLKFLNRLNNINEILT